MKTLKKTVKTWLRGLWSAFVGGAASAVSTTIVAPEQFNFGNGLGSMLKVALVAGCVNLAFYLKQSPIWRDEDDAPSTDSK